MKSGIAWLCGLACKICFTNNMVITGVNMNKFYFWLCFTFLFMVAFLGSVALNFHYGFHIFFFFLSVVGAVFTGHYDVSEHDDNVTDYRD